MPLQLAGIMESLAPDYFLKMIRNLRQHEEIMLYGNILEISDQEADQVKQFLKTEYSLESKTYPAAAPDFDADAALWAARTIYIAAQLLLYRANEDKDLPQLMPDYPAEPTAAAMLSADLCLRFLPQMIVQLKNIDSEDPLIEVLERKLSRWHYSAVTYSLKPDALDFSVADDPCMRQLYTERIIDNRNLALALHPAFREYVSAQLGLYGHTLWNDFKKNISIPVV